MLTIYLFGLIRKRETIEDIHEYAEDHFSEWFPDLSSYAGYLRRLNRLSTVFAPLTQAAVAEVGSEEVVEVTRDAAALHDRLQPYIYSNAVRAAETGFPYPMTPLALAFPEDETVYGLADMTRRSYRWLIGSSLLATPLYGDDYATAESRHVYLPEGTWMEYDSGKVHEGPTTLEDYPLPVGKTPLFVGGRGIVVEEIEGELKGRLYPIAEAGEYIFYDRDAETRSRVTIDGPDWERPTSDRD